MRYLLHAELTKILQTLEGETYVCAMLQWRAGLRIAEAMAVRRRDIDLEAAQLTVQAGKGGKRRTVPLHEDLAVIFKTILPATKDGTYVSVSYVTMLRRYQRAGLPDTHCLRHSAARHWLLNGLSMPEVSLLLGHSSVQITAEIYAPLVSVRADALQGIA